MTDRSRQPEPEGSHIQASDEAGGLTGPLWSRLAVSGRGRPLGMIILLLASLVLVLFGDVLEPWRNVAFDQHHSAAPREVEHAPVRIVEIDAVSMQKYGTWPWPRHLVAELIEKVADGGASVIGLDLIFPEPDRLSLHSVAETQQGLADHVREALQSVPQNDHTLAGVVSRLPVILGRAALSGEAAEAWVDRDPPMPPTTTADPSLVAALPAASAVITNLPALEENARGFGIVNGAPDSDGVIRKVPTALNIGGEPHATMVLEVLRVSRGAAHVTFIGDDGEIEGVDIGGTFYETESDGRIRPHFTHPLDRDLVSAADVLDGTLDAGEFEGELVLIGVTGLDTAARPATPLAADVHGVEIQAQVLENLILGNRLVRPDWAVGLEAGVLVVLALLVIAFLPVRTVWKIGVVFSIGVVAMVAGAHYAFIADQYLLDPILPSFFGAIVFLSMFGVVLAETDRRRKALRAALTEERVAAARVSGELKAAREIQLGMLPDTSALTGLPETLSIHAYLESARDIGGDMYDAFMIDDHRLFFMVGDVTGKGVPASLFMALSKAISKNAMLREAGLTLDRVFDIANTEISRDNPGSLFVTVFAGIIDSRSGRVEFCNAGHEDPCIVSADGTVRPLHCEGGPPLCVFEGFPYPLESVELASGDTLVVTTDGITEAQNRVGGLYGKDRLQASLAKLAGKTELKQGVAGMVDAMRQFENGADPTDDVTVLAVRFLG